MNSNNPPDVIVISLVPEIEKVTFVKSVAVTVPIVV